MIILCLFLYLQVGLMWTKQLLARSLRSGRRAEDGGDDTWSTTNDRTNGEKTHGENGDRIVEDGISLTSSRRWGKLGESIQKKTRGVVFCGYMGSLTPTMLYVWRTNMRDSQLFCVMSLLYFDVNNQQACWTMGKPGKLVWLAGHPNITDLGKVELSWVCF